MITNPQAVRMDEAIGNDYAWHREAREDERLKLGKRHRKWLSLRYLAQTNQLILSQFQGAAIPHEKALLTMKRLGMIDHHPEDARTAFLRDWIVTRDGQAAVTWHYNVWAPLDCAPTWGLPILVRVPGNDRWPDRFFAMRGERQGDDLVWITPSHGTTYTDKWTTGEWRPIP